MSTAVVDAQDMTELMTDPELGSRVFTLRRSKPGTFAEEGVHQPAFDERQMQGIVQPATAREIELMAEGEHLDKVIAVWAPEELRCGDGNRLGDVLVIDRETFRVIKCEPWPQAGYWRAFAMGFIAEQP